MANAELDSIINRCFQREANSFADLVNATYDEAVQRIGSGERLLSVYRLIHQHLNQIRSGKDFWPWFESLAATQTDQSSQEISKDYILQELGNEPAPPLQYSLRERVASLALGGWFFSPIILAVTWGTQQRAELGDPGGPNLVYFVVICLLVGVIAWLFLAWVLRPVLEGRQVKILTSLGAWVVAPVAAFGLVLLLSVVLIPALEQANASFFGRSHHHYFSPSGEVAELIDTLLASIANWWILMLAPVSWVLLVVSRKLHGMVPWVWRGRPGKAYYLFWVPLVLVFGLCSMPVLGLLRPVEPPQSFPPTAPPADPTVTRELEGLWEEHWKASRANQIGRDYDHVLCKQNLEFLTRACGHSAFGHQTCSFSTS